MLHFTAHDDNKLSKPIATLVAQTNVCVCVYTVNVDRCWNEKNISTYEKKSKSLKNTHRDASTLHQFCTKKRHIRCVTPLC